MNVYDVNLIKQSVSISRYLNERGIPVRGSRAVATWRGGTHESVSFDDAKGVWHDHVNDEGGDVIKLCEIIEGLDFLGATRVIGDRFNLEPTKKSIKPKKTGNRRRLEADGWRLIKEYPYTEEDGTLRYTVQRWERIDKDGKREKTFNQCGPNGDTLEGITPTLYRIASLASAGVIHLTEGEKDADTLAEHGFTATTNSGGASQWKPEWGKYFADKDVIVHLDNDDKGQKRKSIIVPLLTQVARSVKCITISKLPKGDVTDWYEREGGSDAKLMAAIEAVNPEQTCPPEIAAAKSANQEPLRNYSEIEVDAGNGKTKTKRIPRPINDICEDSSVRFLGYPKVLGTQLFDYAKDSKQIITLDTDNDLHAWIDGVSRRQSEFQPGVGFATYHTLMSRLTQTRQHFDVVAKSPWYPERKDAFCAFDPLPQCDKSHPKFNELMSFFSPATKADATLIRAFFLAPMYFTRGERPAWVVDSIDGQGSGKSKVVEKCCLLYREEPMSFDLNTMKMDVTKITGELLSKGGREKRIVLFDNVTESFKNGNLAAMITRESISGRRPYGRGTETRRNDITWTATSNGATLDTDAAVRFYVIHVKAPTNPDPFWEEKIDAFIEENRAIIHAEMMDMLANAKKRSRHNKSRFGKFDSVVLSAACDTDEQFYAADAKIAEASDAANDDAELAAQFVEAMTDSLTKWDDSSRPENEKISPYMPIAIRCSDVDKILRLTQGAIRNWTSKAVRRYVNSGAIKNIIKDFERSRTGDFMRYFGDCRCFIFAANAELLKNVDECQFVIFKDGALKRIGVGKVA